MIKEAIKAIMTGLCASIMIGLWAWIIGLAAVAWP